MLLTTNSPRLLHVEKGCVEGIEPSKIGIEVPPPSWYSSMFVYVVMNIVGWIISEFSSRKGQAEPESNRIVVTSDVDVGEPPNRDFGTEGRAEPHRSHELALSLFTSIWHSRN